MRFADLVQKCRWLGHSATWQQVRATSALPPQSRQALTRLVRQFRATCRLFAPQQTAGLFDHLVWPFGVDEWPDWVRMMHRLDPSYRT